MSGSARRPLPGASAVDPARGGLGIRAQLLIVLVGIVAIGFALVYLVATPLLEGAMRDEHRDRQQTYAASVAAALEAVEDADALDSVLSRFSIGQCVAVADARGGVSAPGRARLGACVESDELDLLLQQSAEHTWLTDRGGGERLALVTRISLAAIPFGPGADARLVVVENVRGITSRVAVVRVLLALFLGLAIVLTTLIGFGALTRLIVGPIRRLGRAIERLHEGDRDAQAPLDGGRELRTLAHAFNRLAKKLGEDEQHIALQLSELRLVNTQLERAQEHLVRSEKLASVGQLAAGVAHEIGNPIAVAIGYLELTRRSDTTEEERRDYTARAVDAIQRVSGILRDLLDFSRPGADGEPRGDAAFAVQHCVQLLGPQPRLRHAELVTALDAEPLFVALADHRLVQVLLNLVLNAADATDGREDARIVVSAERAEGRVLLRVTDNGPGIPDAVKGQIFDPFFTTKEPGKGTGLGLSICYGILNAAGGDLRLERTDASGTTFLIDLPEVT